MLNMLIVTIRTDKPEAEIGLYNNREQLAYQIWPAHRQLAETIHCNIAELLKGQQKTWDDVEALIVYEGPGSFTGLRIGLSMANALAYANKLPIVATSNTNWIEYGMNRLQASENDYLALPMYGLDPHITLPKK